nr:hypothetical protein [Tanacetum cinerariifolium]
MGYGDYKIENVTILRVYFVKGLGHNLFSVGQFCDSDLEVVFHQHTCFIRNLNGVDLLTGSRENNLYTLSLQDMMASSPICLLSKASKIKSWLWHRRLSHLNFGAINHLARQGLVRGLSKLKFENDHLCSVKCLRSKDEAPNFIIKFLKMIQVRLKVSVRRIRTDNGTEFVNQTLREYYEEVGISHETSVARSPQQNGVVERRNRTLIEAACTMLIYAQALLFLWAEAVTTACYTKNRSIIRLRYGKTPYELMHNKLPDLSFLHVFGALCYPTNDSENLGKLQPKADIGIFIGYAPTKKAFWIYNRHTRRIVETIHVDFDELTAMASEQGSLGPALNEMTPATISSGLPSVDHQAPEVIALIVDTTPETQSSVIPQDVEEDIHDIKVAHMGNDLLFVSTQLQLHEQALFCYYDAFLTLVEPKTYKDALTQSCWIEAMQEELNEFERLEVEHKDTKKSNEMYYPRFTKVIIQHFMSKDPSISRRNKVNWHYVRDDHMFTTIKLVSRHQNTQQFDAMLPIELTNEDIRNSNAYKEYYAVATGATPPKPKASVWKTRSCFDTTITPPTAAAGPRLTTSKKGKQAAKASKAKNEGTGSIPGVLDVPTDESKEEISWNSTDEEGDDDEQASDEEEFIHPSLSTHAEEEPRDEESFDPIPKTPENSNDEGNGEENVGREEGHDEEEDELYRDVNINQGRGMESIFETTSQMDVQTPTSVAPLHMSAPTITPSTITTITTTHQAPIPATTAPSTLLQDLPNFGSLFGFDNRLRTLEANYSEFMQTNQFAGAVSSIPGIVHRYMDQWMNESVKVAIQLQSYRLREEAQKENDEFLKTIDENMQKIIKEQVKEQVKTSYVVAADLSEMELKKILIEKMEGNKSIRRSNEQRNLYKALVEAYESDKIILETYGDAITLKRRRDGDAEKDEEPSAGSDRGSKRRREGKEHESASDPKEKATRSAGKSTQGSKSRQTSASESATAEEPLQTTFEMEEPSHLEFDRCVGDQPIIESSQHHEWFSQQKKPPTPDRDWNKALPATHGSIQPWISELAKQSDSRSSFNELMDTPVDFSNFLINRLKVDTLTLELLAAPTYELMKGSCKSLVELEFFLEEVYKATTDQLDWVNPEESARDMYSKRRIIVVTELKIVEWHNYKHLDWITVRRDDDKLYKFKEGDFKRPRIQYIEDMLLLLVQGKLTNLTVEERFTFNVSLRMFTRSIVIQRRVEDLQLGVESYQKKLNLTKPDTYRSDLKRKEAYTAYSNPRGFIH